MTTQQQTNIKQWITKWCIVISFAGLIFYLVYPKYQFINGSPALRLNKITGEVEQHYAKKWFPF